MQTEPWVVTCRVECKVDHRIHGLRLHASSTTMEVYRGEEAECRRIADHLVWPSRFRGNPVIHFATQIGLARDWDDFMREAAAQEAQGG